MIHIYKIVHKDSGKVYVGRTKRPKRRWIEHKSDFKKKKYSGSRLANALLEFGKDAFYFEVILSVETIEEAYEKEIFYIKAFQSTNPQYGYNISEGGKGYGARIGENNPRYLKDRNRIKKAAPSGYKNHSEYIKATMSGIKKQQWANGVYASEDYRNKMKNAKMGVPLLKKRKQIRCNETGRVFDSLEEAAHFFTGNPKKSPNIISHLKGKTKTAYGHTFSYLNN